MEPTSGPRWYLKGSRPLDTGGAPSTSGPHAARANAFVCAAAALIILSVAVSALAVVGAAGTDATQTLEDAQGDDEVSSDSDDDSGSDSSDGDDGSDSESSDDDTDSSSGSSDDDDGSASGSSDGDESTSGSSDGDDGSSSPSSDQGTGPASIDPAFSWNPTAPRVRETIQFHDQTEAEDELEAWRWDLGDGSNAQVQDPAHAYEEPGTYTVRLTVTDSEENPATATQEIEVDPGPLDDVVFTNAPTKASTREEVVFEAQPRDAFGNAREDHVAYKRSSGPGQINPQTGVYTSPEAGTAILHAIVRADDGSLQQWATTTVTVVGPVDAATRSANSSNPEAIREEATCPRRSAVDAHGDGSGERSETWGLDGAIETVGSGGGLGFETALPAQTGPDQPLKPAVGTRGPADTGTAPIASSAAPPPPPCEAAFEATCEGLNCTLEASIQAPNGSLAFTWSIDGETTAEGETVNRSFDHPGSYEVTLAVTDADGLVDHTTETLQVEAGTNGNQTAHRDQDRPASTPGPGSLIATGALLAVAVYRSMDRPSGGRGPG